MNWISIITAATAIAVTPRFFLLRSTVLLFIQLYFLLIVHKKGSLSLPFLNNHWPLALITLKTSANVSKYPLLTNLPEVLLSTSHNNALSVELLLWNCSLDICDLLAVHSNTALLYGTSALVT